MHNKFFQVVGSCYIYISSNKNLIMKRIIIKVIVKIGGYFYPLFEEGVLVKGGKHYVKS